MVDEVVGLRGCLDPLLPGVARGLSANPSINSAIFLPFRSYIYDKISLRELKVVLFALFPLNEIGV
jgi:hypothetical protein